MPTFRGLHHGDLADPSATGNAAGNVGTGEQQPDVAYGDAQALARFVAGPVAEEAGLRNLYFASAVMLLSIAVAGFLRLRKPGGPA